MTSPFFRFKQFRIWHDKCAMKVGTDGVLIGAWASMPVINTDKSEKFPPKGNILDIGSGSGLISIMVAQRFPYCDIEGIDIDKESVEQSIINVKGCPWRNRITIRKFDIKNINNPFCKYNLIVSNPPYYQEETYSGIDKRDNARHTTSLPFYTLIEKASLLLAKNGVFAVIIPNQSADDFIEECNRHKLFLRRRCDVKTKEGKTPKRSLLEFTNVQCKTTHTSMTLYNTSNHMTPEYVELTKDFYI